MNNIEKLKHCKYGKHDLPLTEFSSTRAKYCTTCKRIRALEMQKQSRLRSIERLKTKVKKTKKKAKTKTLAQWKKTTQRVVNKFIRERDQDETCLACLRTGKMDASHYVNQGSSGYLRYHPENIHNTCQSCNRFKGGNKIEYRINLVKKIGVKRVEWLETNRSVLHKYTREQLEEIVRSCKRNTYNVKCWYEIMQKV